MDDIYIEMTDVMKAGLVQVRKEERGERIGGNLGSLRRLLCREGVSIKQKLTAWLKCKDLKERRQRREEYCKMRGHMLGK